MKVTRQSRNYAETVGHAVAFGVCVTTCDVFQNPTMAGYIHSVRDTSELSIAVSEAFSSAAFFEWTLLMRRAEDLAHERDDDTCGYGVCLVRTGNRLSMSIVRHYYGLDTALHGAEMEMTESAVYAIEDYDTPIYLEENGFVPGTDGFYEQRANYELEYIHYDKEYNDHVKSRPSV